MKADIETVQEVLESSELEPELAQKILKQIENQAEAEAEAAKAERVPAQKKQFVLLVSDPNGTIKTDLVGWAVQIPEDDAPATTTERLIRAAYEFNISKKGRKYPVKTIGEASEAVGARFFKEQDIWIKNKVPVQVIVTDNVIPEIEDDFPSN